MFFAPRLSIRGNGNTPLAACSTFSLNLLLIQRKPKRPSCATEILVAVLPKAQDAAGCSGLHFSVEVDLDANLLGIYI